jgi:hypothetical protein
LKQYKAIVGMEVEETRGEFAVTVLRFNLTEVTDENLAVIRAFPRLRCLELVETFGISPAALGYLEAVPGLEELNLCNSSAARDEGMVHVAKLAGLRVLHLNANYLTDVALEALAGLRNLEWLHLEHAHVTDRGLPHISGMTKLRWLSLENTHITDQGLRHLLPLSELEYLALCGTSVSDAGIAVLNRLPKLKYLNLYHSRVSEQGLAEIRDGVLYHSEFRSTRK